MPEILAPIVLFVYNRPEHTCRTLEALAANQLAKDSVLYVFADGPKQDADEQTLNKIAATRDVVKQKQWCGKVHIIAKDKNKGLANSIVEGVTEVVNKYGSIIVLEDDIVTSPGFLTYMNDALEIYRNCLEVMEVSGFMFPIKSHSLPDTFLYNANTCWGWGTWERAWRHYDNNASRIYNNLISQKVDWSKFNAFQDNAFQQQLVDNINGKINTWAVKWHAAMYLNNGSVLHPKKSLVKNIGFDGSGVHCGMDNSFTNMDIVDSIPVIKHNKLKSAKAKKVLYSYFNPKRSLKLRLKHKVLQYLKKL